MIDFLSPPGFCTSPRCCAASQPADIGDGGCSLWEHATGVWRRAFETSRRREVLPFKHHAEVAAFCDKNPEIADRLQKFHHQLARRRRPASNPRRPLPNTAHHAERISGLRC
jgi:hypothetical protein